MTLVDFDTWRIMHDVSTYSMDAELESRIHFHLNVYNMRLQIAKSTNNDDKNDIEDGPKTVPIIRDLA